MTEQAPMQDIRWHRFGNKDDMDQHVAKVITELANKAIAHKGSFHVVLAGGDTPRDIYSLLRQGETDWSCWHVYFSDERCQPANFPERNDVMARETLLDYVPIPATQVHAIPAELPQPECVAQYTQTLAGVGTFDLVLLGIGHDCHTASLFPGYNWGRGAGAPAVLAFDRAPANPPHRISLSANRLSDAKHVWFLVCGPGKQQALLRWQSGEFLPLSAINPPNGLDVFVAP